jgi:hypothetical protein
VRREVSLPEHPARVGRLSTVNRKWLGVCMAAGVGTTMFGLAFVAAPRSCDGGLEFYFWGGVAALAFMLATPFAVRMSNSLLVCAGWSAILLVLGVGVWLAGFAAANVRILCRLF